MKNLIIFTIIGTALLCFGFDVYACAGCGCQAEKETKKEVKPACDTSKKAECPVVKKGDVAYITKDTLQNLMKAKDSLVIIDVLGAEKYAKGHIKGAINIPLKKLDNKELLANMDKSKTYVVYCANAKCQASVKAAKLLMKNGFKKVYDYKNGIAEWKEEKLPLDTGKLCKCGMVKGSPVCCK